jgi:hypothetical protein
MIENHRSGLLWDLFMDAPEIELGLEGLEIVAERPHGINRSKADQQGVRYAATAGKRVPAQPNLVAAPAIANSLVHERAILLNRLDTV